MDLGRSADTASRSAPSTAQLLSGEVLSRQRFSGVKGASDEENSTLKDVASESTTLVESIHKSMALEEPMEVSEQKLIQDQEISRADSVAKHIRKKVKIGVVGERGCGMTSLTMGYEIRSTKTRNCSQNYSFIFQSSHVEYPTEITITEGNFLCVDVILICVEISKRGKESMGTIFDKWIPEIVKSHEDTPLILVGCKGDLRSSKDKDIISIEQLQGVSQRIGALEYIECSAVTGGNIDYLFSTAAKFRSKSKVAATSINVAASGSVWERSASERSLLGVAMNKPIKPKRKWSRPWK